MRTLAARVPASRCLAAAIAVVALAGCSDTAADRAEDPAATPTTTLTADPNEASEATEPPAEQSFEPDVGDRALRVGETRGGVGLRTTLLEIKYPFPPSRYREPERGRQFVGLRLKQCMRETIPPSEFGDYSTYAGDWYAASPTGEQATGGSSWVDWPAPKFPENVTLNPGDCLSGWITTEVPAGMKIERIIWRPEGTTTAEWLP